MEEAKAEARPATRPAPAIAKDVAPAGSSPRPTVVSRAKIVVLQHTNSAIKAVLTAESRFTLYAIADGSLETIDPIQAKRRPISRKTGAPGGCTT